MESIFKLTVVFAIVFFAMLWRINTGEAFHSGGTSECRECHEGGGAALRGSDASSTCLRCHEAPQGAQEPNGHYVATNNLDLRAGMPPSQLTPGGDFGYLKKNYSWQSSSARTVNSSGERHGHNIVALDYGYEADSKNTIAPGGSYPGNALSCVSCHDPHGKMAKGAYRMLGGIGYKTSSAPGSVFTVDAPVAVAPRDYNRSEAVSDTRVAYGAGMSEWCSNCHAGGCSGAYGHPVCSNAKFTMEIISNYAAYVKSGDINGRGDASYVSLTPFEEGTDDKLVLAQHAKTDGSYAKGPDFHCNVMCLTCHRAHASGWDNMARWNMSAEFIVRNSIYPGTDNGSPTRLAQGRTVAETQRALYDRPISRFASYQRGLCNKCHMKD